MDKKDKHTPTVNVAKLKNQLSRYLSLTKKGHEIIVVEHKMPIAKVIPYSAEPSRPLIREPIRPLNLKKWLSTPVVKRDFDAVKLLLEDRNKR